MLHSRNRLLARKGGADRGLQRGCGGGCGAGKSPDRAELENSFSSLGPATRRPQAGDCFVGKRGRGRVCPVPPSTHYPRQQQVNPTSEGQPPHMRINQSINQSINHSIIQSINQSIIQSTIQLVIVIIIIFSFIITTVRVMV